MQWRALVGEGDLSRAASLRAQVGCSRSGDSETPRRIRVQGSREDSFFNNTMPAAAACRASTDRSSLERRATGGGVEPLQEPQHAIGGIVHGISAYLPLGYRVDQVVAQE